MWEALIGMVVGSAFSLAIAEVYHRRSGRELDQRVDKLDGLYDELCELVYDARDQNLKETERVYLATVPGTPDDSDWPYK